MADFILEMITEGLFWSTGAGLKKLTGRPLSETGASEKWLGFLFYLALIASRPLHNEPTTTPRNGTRSAAAWGRCPPAASRGPRA
jgi:hypothetical protein